MVLEYEGTEYSGFQAQADASSIQEEIEKAIERFTGERSRVKGAGRTDAGVHALGQVVAVDTESKETPETFVRALNHYLPDDIAVKGAFAVRDGFDPRRDALRRIYRYVMRLGTAPSPITRRTEYQIRETLDTERMRRAARSFVGQHNFSRFAGPLERVDASTTRHIYRAAVSKQGETVTFEVEGNAFLPHQVRRMVGALIDIGRKKLSTGTIKSLLEGKGEEIVAHAAPPHGLFLVGVKYGEGELDARIC
jgi:tRNA pseudouridine38-40 synthase